MKIVNIHEAKTHLSRLIDSAVEGESFIIAKAGRPLVKVVSLTAADGHQRQRLGFFTGRIALPADFNTLRTYPLGDEAGGGG